MPIDMETIVAIALVLLMALAFVMKRKHKSSVATLVEKQELKQECAILTFVIKSGNTKLNLKVGEQLSIGIKNNPAEGRKHFTPISLATGSFKILYIPLISSGSDHESQVNSLISKLETNQQIVFDVVKSNFKYLGNSTIQVTSPENKQLKKKFKDLFIISQGAKTQITYQIVKGIVEHQSADKPVISILFVGEGIGDFALKEQFSELEENNDNLKYYYSIPIKGERQPTLEGLGISSEKIDQSFHTDPNDTFCIICAQQNELSVAVERSLLNKKIPRQNIFNY